MIWKSATYLKNNPGDSQQITTLKSAPQNEGKIHNVQYGDTLWDIARMYEGVTIEKIKKLNNLKSDQIKPGQKLKIG